MVTVLYIFKIWLCTCELRGNSLYAIGRVFDYSTVQTGKKRAECIGAEDRTVQGCDSRAWFDISCLPWHQPCPSHPFLAWGNLGLMLWSSGGQMRRTHFCGLLWCKPWTSKTHVSFSSVRLEAGNASSTLTVCCAFLASLFCFLMNAPWITQISSCWRSTNFHIPAVLYDVLCMRLTHLIAPSPDESSKSFLLFSTASYANTWTYKGQYKKDKTAVICPPTSSNCTYTWQSFRYLTPSDCL